MGLRIARYFVISLVVAGLMALALVAGSVAWVAWDRSQPPEAQRLSDANLRLIGWMFHTPGARLAAAPDEPVEPQVVSDMGPQNLEERVAEIRRLAEEARARRAGTEGAETLDLERVLMEALTGRIEKDLAALGEARQRLQTDRDDWRAERAEADARIARLANAVVMRIYQGVDPEIVAQDWLKIYNDTPVARQQKLVEELAEVLSQIKTDIRADIATEMDPALRIAITEHLRRVAAAGPSE